jgi:peptidoglycan/LPS O-acetylase OafA/YrhL
MRAEQITFTRFFAALSIVVFHFGKNISPFNESSIKILFLQAHIGVSYFFLLSGFIMILAYK